MKYIKYFENARYASRALVRVNEKEINRCLFDLAELAEHNFDTLVHENRKDLNRMDPADPLYDRLELTEERIRNITKDIRTVAGLPSPLGKIMDERLLENGLHLKKVSVPLGVAGIIYEARPNVTFDVFSLCIKSGNVCVLKGGSDAENSNIAIVNMIRKALEKNHIPVEVIQLLPANHEATFEMLAAVGYLDVIIPRGGQSLIDFVRQHARVPVIETGAGIVHTYFDVDGDLHKGARIITNAKLRRVSVCNALDCLIIHQSRLPGLPVLLAELGRMSVEIFADEPAFQALQGKYPETDLKHASEEHFGIEFLSKKLAVKTVQSLDEALDHMAKYSSRHSEAIISDNQGNIDRFLNEVDAAAVYANASTAFTDGAQFGMGAEIGISTQKLHARGPMALQELTSYKWVVRGDGQVRNP